MDEFQNENINGVMPFAKIEEEIEEDENENLCDYLFN